jgi:hypothetical protein
MKLNTSKMIIFGRCCSKSCRQYRGEQLLFSPLHGVVHGRLCRAWHLGVVLHGILHQHPDHAKKRDAFGSTSPFTFFSSPSSLNTAEPLRGIMPAMTRMILGMILEAYPEGSSSNPMAMEDRMVCPGSEGATRKTCNGSQCTRVLSPVLLPI